MSPSSLILCSCNVLTFLMKFIHKTIFNRYWHVCDVWYSSIFKNSCKFYIIMACSSDLLNNTLILKSLWLILRVSWLKVSSEAFAQSDLHFNMVIVNHMNGLLDKSSLAGFRPSWDLRCQVPWFRPYLIPKTLSKFFFQRFLDWKEVQGVLPMFQIRQKILYWALSIEKSLFAASLKDF